MNTLIRTLMLAALLGIAAPASALSRDEIAKLLSNPVANLASVPLQFNHETGAGVDGEGYRTRLNIQPVLPMSLGEDWNLISRTILPLVDQHGVIPGPVGAPTSQHGSGDVLQSLFFSPKEKVAGGWIAGFGAALLLPTASDDLLGGHRWGAGPTAVALRQDQGWTYGMLANHILSFGGAVNGPGKDVSATFMQPFLSRRIGPGRTLSANAEATYDWKASAWVVPLQAGLSQVLPLPRQMLSVQAGALYYAQAPAGFPEWGARLTLTLLYPRI